MERTPVSMEEALARILRHVPPPLKERVGLAEAAGRILAEPLVAEADVPAFRRSGVDGYAVRSQDVLGAAADRPIRLRVVGTVQAGDPPLDRPVGPGEAVRVMTGAPVPDGADAVVMLEHVEPEAPADGGDEAVGASEAGKAEVFFTAKSRGSGGRRAEAPSAAIVVRRPIEMGKNVIEPGEDVRRGERLLSPGERLRSGAIALFAAYGYSSVAVFRPPRVVVISTGDELLEPGVPPAPGKIYDSNAPMLVAALRVLGVPADRYGIVPDRPEALGAAFRLLVDRYDVLITTGGVSDGDYDWVHPLIAELGGEVLFSRLQMKPGQPTSVARLGRAMLFALAGHPGASFVGFHLFVRPFVLSALGVPPERARMPEAEATLEVPFGRRSKLPRVVPVRYRFDGPRLVVRPTGRGRSSHIAELAPANGLMVVPPGEGLPEGAAVRLFVLDALD
ncbi:gephyrin-like molybdotransferase Glp [Hydrogenibacillus sp. N12]|uniref:molybdopterin molybdotransferase MoeA n=1 Tax=Hydrogenibacillus sp. N12 TaxID=2866627 RepID=UPI001C7DAB0D|nr:gephyrin-like molybdotransferase Glp [Hydrogenibacillus sp. N12]QZA32220.1 molybdopterin molybdotransferase MoeA [Hydrogenibacillus sp. N12]